jgi:hypothetical protein
MTRAKHGLIIFGNANMLRQDKMWGMMLKTHKMQVFSDMKAAIDFIQEQKKQWNLQSKESKLRL